MQSEVEIIKIGEVVEGKVKKIKEFGAFIEIKNGKTGLVHISEISNGFVKKVEEHLKEGQEVKVKVISISPSGKIELSIKKAALEENKKDQIAKFEQQKKKISETKFEDMISKFKKLSDEKLLDFKKKSEVRRPRSSHKNGI